MECEEPCRDEPGRKKQVITGTSALAPHSQYDRNSCQKLPCGSELFSIIYLLPMRQSPDCSLVGRIVGSALYVVKHDIIALQAGKK